MYYENPDTLRRFAQEHIEALIEESQAERYAARTTEIEVHEPEKQMGFAGWIASLRKATRQVAPKGI